MQIQALLRKLRVGERTLKRWAGQALIERPVGKNWPESVLVEGMVARHMLDQGRGPETIRQAREQGLQFLEMGPAFCVIDRDLFFLFEVPVADWLIGYAKARARVALDQPWKLWVCWDQRKSQLEFLAGHPDYVLSETGGKCFIEQIHSDPDGQAWKKPPRRWKKSKKIGEFVGPSYRQAEG